MTTENIALFKGMGAKMQYLNHRQRIIAQNIANADTPGYKPHDLTEVDFGSVVKRVEKSSGNSSAPSKSLAMATSESGHMVNSGQQVTKDQKQRESYEVAPAGNAVIMEEQMVKSQETVMDYSLMTNLYKKNVGLIMTSLGKN